MSAFKPPGLSSGGITSDQLATLVSDGELSAAEAAILASVAGRASTTDVLNAKTDLLAAIAVPAVPVGSVHEFLAGQVPAGYEIVGSSIAIPAMPGTIAAVTPDERAPRFGTYNGNGDSICTGNFGTGDLWAWPGSMLPPVHLSLSTGQTEYGAVPPNLLVGCPCEYVPGKVWTGTAQSPGSNFVTTSYIFDYNTRAFSPSVNCVSPSNKLGVGGCSVPLGNNRVFWLPRRLADATSNSLSGNTDQAVIFTGNGGAGSVAWLTLVGWPSDWSWGEQTTPAIAVLPSGLVFVLEPRSSSSTGRRYALINPSTGAATVGAADQSNLNHFANAHAAASSVVGCTIFTVQSGTDAQVDYIESTDTFSTRVPYLAGTTGSSSTMGCTNGRAIPISTIPGNYAVTFMNGAGQGSTTVALVLAGIPRIGTVKARKT